MNDNLFREPIATQLENKRNAKRGKRQITYDCWEAKVKGGHVYCKRGYSLGQHGTLSLEQVLNGGSCEACHKCSYHPGDNGDDYAN